MKDITSLFIWLWVFTNILQNLLDYRLWHPMSPCIEIKLHLGGRWLSIALDSQICDELSLHIAWLTLSLIKTPLILVISILFGLDLSQFELRSKCILIDIPKDKLLTGLHLRIIDNKRTFLSYLFDCSLKFKLYLVANDSLRGIFLCSLVNLVRKYRVFWLSYSIYHNIESFFLDSIFRSKPEIPDLFWYFSLYRTKLTC